MADIIKARLPVLGPYLQQIDGLSLVMLKSSNDNALVFTTDGAGGTGGGYGAYGTTAPSLAPSWLIAKNGQFVHQAASMMDKTLLNVTVDASGTVSMPFNIDKTVQLVLDASGRPALISELNRTPARLDVVYVALHAETLSTTQVTMYGRSLDTGAENVETLTVDLSWMPANLLK